MTASERLLGGRYEVGELLGYGGMAEVHKGRDLRLGRDVAIKMLRTDLARDNTFQMRFRREAQNAATLNHPGIAAVYDTGEERAATGEALPYIVMEYVKGRTLKDVLVAEGPLQPRRALEVTADICAALEFSHRHGIIHRDVKPGNAMVTGNGQVKVMDFGIARDLASGATTMTQTSAVIGTAQYLSPEQARGEAVDARSDVYATGCLLFELLCGHPPFVGDSAVAVAYQHVREDPKLVSHFNPEVGTDIDAVVMKALAKNPANRCQSAAEMRADLLRAAAGRPVLATPVLGDAETALLTTAGEPARVGDPDRRRASTWVLASLAVLGVLVVVALIAGLILTNQGAEPVEVPDVIGMEAADAVAEIEAARLVAQVGEPVIGTCEQEEGSVEEQSPAGGETLDEGDTVTYRVCGGPDLVTVPEVVGLLQETAELRLENAGLGVQVEPVQDAPEPEGTVVETDPAAGEDVERGSTVTIFVSAGNIVEVPSVVDLTVDEARGRLTQAGFEVEVEDSTQPPNQLSDIGRVESQSPDGGEQVARGRTVTIFVYPEQPDLIATIVNTDPANRTVTVQWENGTIYGPVTINWGFGPPDQRGPQGVVDSPPYPDVPDGNPCQITIQAQDHPERSETLDVPGFDFC